MNRIVTHIALSLLLISTALLAQKSKPINMAILISGGGTNMAAILDAKIEGIKPCVVISNKKGIKGLERAADRGIPTEHVPKFKSETREEYCQKLITVLEKYNVMPENGLICLAGFKLILAPNIVQRYHHRILNIHPAILPSFKGAHGIDDAFNYGVKWTGPTIHFVDEGMDTGPIIMQEIFKIEETDTLEDVEEKMHKIEHKIFPASIELFVQKRLHVVGRKVRVLPPAQ